MIMIIMKTMLPKNYSNNKSSSRIKIEFSAWRMKKNRIKTLTMDRLDFKIFSKNNKMVKAHSYNKTSKFKINKITIVRTINLTT